MTDSLPGFSKDRGAGKPLTKAEWERRDLERRALDLYTSSANFSFPKVRDALGLRTAEVAEKLVRAGYDRYQIEEDEWGSQIYRKAMREDLLEMRENLMVIARDPSASNHLPAIDRLLKVHERLSKLDDLDKAKDQGPSGPVFQLIDVRLPGDRGEVVDAEEAEVLEIDAPE